MTKLVLAICVTTVMVLAGAVAMRAEATPLSSLAKIKSYSSPVQQTGCLFAGRHCRAGFKWVCAPYAAPMADRCRCAPC
jgi:hypothetical protein